MIANIRVRDRTNSRYLCQLDLFRFSEEQVRERMRERGYTEDEFIICGFVDWEVDTEMTLTLAYALKRYINELYDGDETVVIHLLKKHVSPTAIISHYYHFISKDETEAAVYVLRRNHQLATLLTEYIDAGLLLNTENGFYLIDG